jgi:hypothetical protein
MHQDPTPELYLSLLSGCPSNVSHLSMEQRYNNIGSHLSGHPFLKDPDQLMDLLNTLTAVHIWREKGEVFFVSLAIDLKAAIPYVSSNKSIPATIIFHLCIIQDQLKELQKVVECSPSILADNKTSPDPNKTKPHTDSKLKLQKTMYKHLYSKLCLHFSKKAPTILEVYKTTMKSLQANDKKAKLLRVTY